MLPQMGTVLPVAQIPFHLVIKPPGLLSRTKTLACHVLHLLLAGFPGLLTPTWDFHPTSYAFIPWDSPHFSTPGALKTLSLV